MRNSITRCVLRQFIPESPPSEISRPRRTRWTLYASGAGRSRRAGRADFTWRARRADKAQWTRSALRAGRADCARRGEQLPRGTRRWIAKARRDRDERCAVARNSITRCVLRQFIPESPPSEIARPRRTRWTLCASGAGRSRRASRADFTWRARRADKARRTRNALQTSRTGRAIDSLWSDRSRSTRCAPWSRGSSRALRPGEAWAPSCPGGTLRASRTRGTSGTSRRNRRRRRAGTIRHDRDFSGRRTSQASRVVSPYRQVVHLSRIRRGELIGRSGPDVDDVCVPSRAGSPDHFVANDIGLGARIPGDRERCGVGPHGEQAHEQSRSRHTNRKAFQIEPHISAVESPAHSGQGTRQPGRAQPLYAEQSPIKRPAQWPVRVGSPGKCGSSDQWSSVAGDRPLVGDGLKTVLTR